MSDLQWANEQHLYHHNDGRIKINVSIERNTKGYNWSIDVSNAATVDEAIAQLEDGRAKLAALYGEPT